MQHQNKNENEDLIINVSSQEGLNNEDCIALMEQIKLENPQEIIEDISNDSDKEGNSISIP